MSNPQPEKKLQFLICTNCNGLGLLAEKKCKVCQGHGIVAYLDGFILYWGKAINSRHIKLYRLEKDVSLLIKIVLFVFTFLGLASLAYSIYLIDFIGIGDLDFWLAGNNPYHLYFWLTMVTNLYLIYFLSLKKDQKQPVLNRKYKSSNDLAQTAPMPMDWLEVKKFPDKYKIDISKSFTADAWKIIEEAFYLSQKYKALETGPIHYLISGLLYSSKAETIFVRLGVDPEALSEKLGNLAALYSQSEGQTVFSAVSQKILFKAYRLAYLNKISEVDSNDILGEAIKLDEKILELFMEFNINSEQVDNVIIWQRIKRLMAQQWEMYRSSSRLKSKTGIDRAMTAVQTAYLNQFSEDLTMLAKMGYLPLCVDRDKEFEEMFRIMEGSSISGLILIGDPGVGKTAIIEGLAERMIADDVPEFLKDKRLVSLSIPKLVSGASASEAQERLLICINELVAARNVILYINNIHELIGIAAGGAESLDLSDVLVEALSKNLFVLLCDTNTQSYTAVIEKSGLGNILKKLEIKEPEINEAIQIIEGKTAELEAKNQIFFSYHALEQAVKLTDRFIHDQYLPYKALSLLEEVAVWTRKNKGARSVVLGNDVAQLFSDKIGMQVADITANESEKLLHLEEEIHKRIIGQDEAVKAVANSLRRARAELRDIDRPIANLLFLGPTGVGKTELAKAMAKVYFGSEANMIRLDMSEYQEPNSINRLIGAPPGFSGSAEGGQLTEAVRQKPFAIVLLDELEKAHPDILNVFLQVMEDGRLTDATGRTIDFTNVILIATSNATTSFIQQKVNEGLEVEEIKKQLLETELKQYFRPEFINRFDSVIVFKPLDISDVEKIAGIMLNEVAVNLKAKGVNFQATEEAIKELAQVGFDPQYGARPLRRAISDQVDNALAQFLLQGKITRRDLVVLDKGGMIRIEKAKEL